jgi:hypothetical protein
MRRVLQEREAGMRRVLQEREAGMRRVSQERAAGMRRVLQGGDPMVSRVLVLWAVLGMGLSACGQSGSNTAGVETLRTVVGDTTIVRTLAGSVWGDSVRLVEELAIGVLEGADEYLFGRVGDLAVDAGGGIYVFDGQVPALRYYDANGSYVRTLGGSGEGPGEYRDASLGMAVRRSDGRVVMRDPRNMRLNVYNPDGSHSESWRVGSGLFTQQATALDDSDHMYLKILTGPPEPNEPWPIALLHMDHRGQVLDTIVPPTLPNEPSGVSPFSKIWSVSRAGGLLVGVNDRYVIHHYRPDGTVLQIIREIEPVAYAPEEKAEREARDAWMIRTQGQFLTSDLPPVPDVKPFFRSILVGEDGRVWIRRYSQAEKGEAVQASAQPGREPPPPTRWREPAVYDVFEADGSFLGSVRLPPRVSVSIVRGDHVWGVRRGEFDESYVVRFRLVRNPL